MSIPDDDDDGPTNESVFLDCSNEEVAATAGDVSQTESVVVVDPDSGGVLVVALVATVTAAGGVMDALKGKAKADGLSVARVETCNAASVSNRDLGVEGFVLDHGVNASATGKNNTDGINDDNDSNSHQHQHHCSSSNDDDHEYDNRSQRNSTPQPPRLLRYHVTGSAPLSLGGLWMSLWHCLVLGSMNFGRVHSVTVTEAQGIRLGTLSTVVAVML